MNSPTATKTTAIGTRQQTLLVSLMLGTLVSSANAGVTTADPIRAPAPHDILKNRYISIDPRGAGPNFNPPDNTHIRVEVDSSLVPDLVGTGPWWASDPVNGAAPSPATCLSILRTDKPATPPNFTGCNVVHLGGCPIIPTTTYRIQAEVGGELSAGTLLDTQAKPGDRWLGDLVGRFTGPNGNPPNVWTAPNGTVNIDDAFAGIKTHNDPNASNATHLTVSDIHPVLNGVQINLKPSIDDVLITIFGYQGKTYGEVADPNGNPSVPDLTECP